MRQHTHVAFRSFGYGLGVFTQWILDDRTFVDSLTQIIDEEYSDAKSAKKISPYNQGLIITRNSTTRIH